MFRRFFTPNHLQQVANAPPSFTVLSGSHFRIANRLRALGVDGVFAATIMFVAAHEAFLQEHLTLSAYGAELDKNTRLRAMIEDLKLGRGSYRNFNKWVREIYRLYDRKGVGIDTNSDEYHNLLALRELRNSVTHYNPAFIEYVQWPERLQQALHLSKAEVFNSGWVTSFNQVAVAAWAHDTVKNAVQLFCRLSGGEDPFTAEVPGIRWE